MTRTTWSIKWWICGWFYWLSTSSSTMIAFSLVHARSVFGCCASVLAIFESLYFTRFTATHFGCGEIFDDCFIANFPESVPVNELWKSFENWLSYWYGRGVLLFWNTVYTYNKIPHKACSACNSMPVDGKQGNHNNIIIIIWLHN